MPTKAKTVDIAPGLTAEVYDDGQVLILASKDWYLDGICDPQDPGQDDEPGILLRPKAAMDAIYGR